MAPFSIVCEKCGRIIRGNLNVPTTFLCQRCGGTVGKVVLSEEYKNKLLCVKCKVCGKEVIWRNEEKYYLLCIDKKCNRTVLEATNFINISKISTLEEGDKKKEYIKQEQINFPSIKKQSSIPPIIKYPSIVNRELSSCSNVKIAIPYYNGGDRIDRAINSWIYPETVFIITDETTVPPGRGVCHQIFTPINGLSVGITKNTTPFIIDILKKLRKYFPDEEYYGYFNSDIILPLGNNIKNLLPSKGKKVVFHHRFELDGKDTDPIHKLKKRSQTYVGKDGFIASADIIDIIIKDLKDMVVGSACWDDGMVVWLWKRFGYENVELRYGEIYHVLHEQQWRPDDKGSKFNNNQLEKSNIAFPFRANTNWMKIFTVTENLRDRKTMGIVQPGRIGDIIIALPIAKWYYDRGYNIVWPVVSEYLSLFNNVPYVEVIDIGDGIDKSYERSITKLKYEGITEILDLGIGFGRNEKEWIESKLPFDQWKYKEAKIPFEERFNLQITRNYEKELQLFNELGLQNEEGQYVFSHSISSKGKVDLGVEDFCIEFKIMNNYNIWDWIRVIEKAKWIYCCDSCFAHLVNELNLAIGRRTFKRLPKAWYLGRSNLAASIDWEFEHVENTEKVEKGNIQVGAEKHEIAQKKNKLFPIKPSVPVHFFTIVLNGKPFIDYHIEIFKKLPFEWHWHIVEGIADLKYDTAWSISTGGKILPCFFDKGVSVDGTHSYLEKLAEEYPSNVSVYWKDGIWDGKLEMVNAPISNLPEECILWQVDVDEFWDVPNICNMVDMFTEHPEKMGAYIYCYYFIGPRRYIQTLNTWATMSEDWLRVFRFKKGFKWKYHEPPTLVDKNGIDQVRKYVFSRQDTMERGINFQHFAYSIQKEMEFKESYYGYKDAVKLWKKLQKASEEVDLFDYLPWTKKGTITAIWDEDNLGKLLFRE